MHSFVKFIFLSTSFILTACTDNSPVFSSSVSGTAKQTSAGSAGYYKIGNPYQVAGVWYYPKEDYTYKEIGVSSWYGPDFHNGITANGELYDMHGLTAAHRTLPLPSIVRVTNLQNGRSLVLRVNDRGPFVNNRVIDVSMRAAQMLGFKDQGTTQVQVEILPEESKKLKEELLAAANKNDMALDAASTTALNEPEYTREQIEKPQNLAYSPNYPRLANPPPATNSATVGTPLIAAAANPQTNSEYNDWDEDLPKSKLQKSPEVSKTKGPSPSAPAKTIEKKAKALPETKAVAPGYYVQVGAFGNMENAERMRDRVSSFGSALILPVTVNSKTLYRVRLGPENAKKALEIMDKVTESGIAEARLVEEKTSVPAGKRLDNAF